MNFSHSGNLGDLIYSLAVLKKMNGGNFYIKLGNIPNVIRKYNNGPVPAEYINRFNQIDFEYLKPLLEAQPYVNLVEKYDNQNIDVDLDEFRGTIHRTVFGNFLKAYYTTHNIPFTEDDLNESWLTVPESKKLAKFIVARSPRWHGSEPNVTTYWQDLIETNNLSKEGLFIGTIEEHYNFQDKFKIAIPYYRCLNFLDLAQVINGADWFFGNQSFPYSLAQGLGKSTVLETFSARELPVNECYFTRSNCFYF